MLDMLAKSRQHRLIVAHVDHGIRVNSEADARFVRALAQAYQLPFVTKRFELGASASEEYARDARYGFLFEQANKYHATVATAHHQDDLIETMAINCIRGTGWKGMAVLNRQEILRPLLGMRKAQLYNYALQNNLEYVEDETNATPKYLRNRVRRVLSDMPSAVRCELLAIRTKQQQMVREIDREEVRLATVFKNQRYAYIMTDERTAVAVLRRYIDQETGVSHQLPQIQRALHAIKIMRPGTQCEIGEGVRLLIKKTDFVVEMR